VSHDTLTLIWFFLLGVLLVGYVILDGFDLGVGIMHPFAKGDTERRLLMNSIGPLWDGNEVWLITFGGALFAAFPIAYATAFSAFYVAFMLLLFALILRAVSLEFRSKTEHRLWRTVWDAGFFLSSFLAAFLFGVAAGNVMIGLPVTQELVVDQTVFEQLSPYPLLVGVLTVLLFAMHGSLFLLLKTEGELRDRAYRWSWNAFGLFLVVYLITTMMTLVLVERATENFTYYPWLWLIPVINVLAIGNIPRSLYFKQPIQAFLSSCATIGALAALFGAALYPNLLPSTVDPRFSLEMTDARSSQRTLGIMLLIAVIGIPFVLSYTTAIYWVFRGKTTLDRMSY